MCHRRSAGWWSILAPLTIAAGPAILGQQIGPRDHEPAADTASIYQRKVQLPQSSPLPAIVMTEFFTLGELDAKGEKLSVQDGRRNPVPWKILQVGPGDVCRIAFQAVPRQNVYRINYGAKGPAAQSPA